MLDDSFCVVLRTNGERTAEYAQMLLRRQCAQVHVIRVAPLSEAVRRCYEIAMRSRARWLLTCDGDILVSKNMARDVQKMAQALHVTHWQAIAQIDDKLSGMTRTAGLRLHRVSMLPTVMRKITGDVIRPEGHLCKVFPRWTRFRYVLGRHDYEQYYADLHQKGAMHRIKHRRWGSAIVPKWRESDDLDLQAALRGWDGLPAPDWPEKAPMEQE